MSKIRKRYAEDFKREPVRLCLEGGNVNAVTRDSGVDHNLLRRWKSELAQLSKSMH